MKKSMECECGGEMRIEKLEVMPDLFSEGFKCEKCGGIEFTEEQMRKALRAKEKAIKLMVTRKLGTIGGSIVLRIPRSVLAEMKLKSGEEVRIVVEKNKMIVEPV